MRIEYSVDDLKHLNFRYMLQVDDHKDSSCVFGDDTNNGFWLEKRLKFIVCNDYKNCSMNGYYYTYSKHLNMTKEELVHSLNKSPNRHYRQLTIKELDWLNNYLLSERLWNLKLNDADPKPHISWIM